jgi:ribosomal protein S18 acetylase RimI-like enzyme
MTCAVDLRNEPALRLYERAGFRAFSRRVALVRVLD